MTHISIMNKDLWSAIDCSILISMAIKSWGNKPTALLYMYLSQFQVKYTLVC